MKEVNFIKAGAVNFCCYIDPIEFEFNNGKMTLVTGPNGCLSGETEIDIPRDLTDNQNGIKIKDLLDKEFYTYCYNLETKQLDLKKAFNVRKTKEMAEVWKVEFEGEKRRRSKEYTYIIATPDHRFLKSNGEYCQLKDLKPGDSLMSFYRREFDGYYHIKPTVGNQYYEHKFIGEKIYGESEIVHHKDQKHFNNEISNLQDMGKSEHHSLHAKLMYENEPGKFMWKEHPKGMKGKKHREETKKRISENNGWTRKGFKEKHKLSMEKYSKSRQKNKWENRDFLYNLYVENKKDAVEIAKDLGCSSTCIYGYLEKFGIERRHKHNHKVTNVYFYGYEDVYDIEVEDCHNFVANGIFVHNSGKTTLFDIIPFCLYGVTSKGLRSDDVVNNKVGKDCLAYTEFNMSEDYYKVERYVNHHKEGDAVYLYKNNVLIKKGQREVIPEIEKILLPYKLFTNTLFFGQKVKTFFTDLTDSDQKEIFRKVLQLDNYADYYDFTSKKIKSLIEELEELQLDLNVNSNLKIDCNNQLLRLQNDKIEFQRQKTEDYNKKEEEYKKADTELTKLDSKEYSTEDIEDRLLRARELEGKILAEHKRLISEKESVISDLTSKINLKKSELKNTLLQRKAAITKEITDRLNVLLSNHQPLILSIEKKVSNITSNNKNLEKSIRDFKSSIELGKNEIQQIESNLNKENPTCYACKQKVGEEEKKELQLVLDTKKEPFEKLLVELQTATKTYNSGVKELKDLSKELTNIKEKYNNEKMQIEIEKENKETELEESLKVSLEKVDIIYNTKLSEIEKSYSESININLKSSQDLTKTIEDYNQKLKEYKDTEKKINDLSSLLVKIAAEMAEIQKRKFNDDFLSDLVQKGSDLDNRIIKLKLDRDEKKIQIKIHEFWKEAFSMSGIPSMLIDEAIPFMNERIAFYLDQIGGRYQVSFDTVNETKSGEYRDKIKINVLDTVTKANSRKQLSGGQVRIVDIATIFTLRDLQSIIQDMSINIILLDEIFDSLDEANISYVSTLLRKMVNSRSINIISHRNIDQIESDEIFRTI